jgi:zinc D-Ala-D-Ala dipeptidase
VSSKPAALLAASLIVGIVPAARAEPPAGFAYLADVDPTIRQDIRYAGGHNFVGRRVDGYLAAECMLTEWAARALKQIQGELGAKKLSLIVWDCYRPVRAVRDFLAWSRIPSDTRMKAEFYPNTDKTQLFALGYLARRSAHSRGSTVDLGIVPVSATAVPAYDPRAAPRPCTAPKGERFEDGTIDFGTGYDCLDPLASTNSPTVSAQAMANRLRLQELMRRFGFKPYSREWWHFELIDDPFRQQAFDFPILPRGPSPTAASPLGPSR